MHQDVAAAIVQVLSISHCEYFSVMKNSSSKVKKTLIEFSMQIAAGVMLFEAIPFVYIRAVDEPSVEDYEDLYTGCWSHEEDEVWYNFEYNIEGDNND